MTGFQANLINLPGEEVPEFKVVFTSYWAQSL